MLLYKIPSDNEYVYIYRQRHCGVVRLLTLFSSFYAPDFIVRASKSTKTNYLSSLILRHWVRYRHKNYDALQCSFSHSHAETLCACTASSTIYRIGVDVEYVTNKSRQALNDYLGPQIINANKSSISDVNIVKVVVFSCMESAFKAWSPFLEGGFRLPLFEVLLITDHFCQLSIKINGVNPVITDVDYFVTGKRIISLCRAQKNELPFNLTAQAK